MKLIFATNNEHKVQEMRWALPGQITICSLKEAGIDIDIPEPFDTLHENAEEKARTIYERTGQSCFSEDAGLEVFALNNEPGVHSARYAGPGKSSADNIDKLLMKLNGINNREAQFRAVVCLVLNGSYHFFEGVCAGSILSEKRGSGGFGYDPVFIPEGSEKTFSEMEKEEKNHFSHRRLAADKLVVFLNNLI